MKEKSRTTKNCTVIRGQFLTHFDLCGLLVVQIFGLGPGRGPVGASKAQHLRVKYPELGVQTAKMFTSNNVLLNRRNIVACEHFCSLNTQLRVFDSQVLSL